LEDDSEKGFFAWIKSLFKGKSTKTIASGLGEEFHELMDEGQAKGLISNEELPMVYGVLELKEIKAHSIMIPRTDISSASFDSTLGEIIELVNECGHTRIPIHRDNVDEILGILHGKDLLKFWGKDPSSKIPPEILRKPYFVPETQRVSEVLKELQKGRTHMAVVTDEYGGTAGLITIEDILEEIVGEIQDEHDREKPLFTVNDDGSLLVDARLEVGKLEEELNVQLPRGDFDSVGGFIIHLLGKIPEVDETISFENLEFAIQKADRRKICRVLVRRKSELTQNREERARA